MNWEAIDQPLAVELVVDALPVASVVMVHTRALGAISFPLMGEVTDLADLLMISKTAPCKVESPWAVLLDVVASFFWITRLPRISSLETLSDLLDQVTR